MTCETSRTVRSGAARLFSPPSVVGAWRPPLAKRYENEGLTAEDAKAEARLGLAVVRGLLLDLLATGDPAGVDAAVERFIACFEQPTARKERRKS
jgi:hypothetical protein